MNELIAYISLHTARGECQCGKCCDKGPDREAPKHSADVHFFWVSAKNDPTKEELLALLKEHYPNYDRLQKGPSYIEIGAGLGDQGLALLLMGLGELVGLWKVMTPKCLGATKEQAEQLAGMGHIMISGIREGT
jgi:hypothetical protein